MNWKTVASTILILVGSFLLAEPMARVLERWSFARDLGIPFQITVPELLLNLVLPGLFLATTVVFFLSLRRRRRR